LQDFMDGNKMKRISYKPIYTVGPVLFLATNPATVETMPACISLVQKC